MLMLLHLDIIPWKTNILTKTKNKAIYTAIKLALCIQ